MTKRKKKVWRRPSRLERIERKCDRILAELLMRRNGFAELDEAIERMHGAAKRMRRQCEEEYEDARRFLRNPSMPWT